MGNRAPFVFLIATALVLLGCGDDGSRTGGDSGPPSDSGPGSDSGTGSDSGSDSDSGADSDGGTGGGSDAGSGSDTDPSTYPLSYSGTLEMSYSFLDMETYDTYTPPAPYADTATVEPNDDYTEITVSHSVCTATGEFLRVEESTGEWVYELDPARASCEIVVNGELVDLTIDGIGMFWGPEGLSYNVSGDGSITNAESIVLIEFNAP